MEKGKKKCRGGGGVGKVGQGSCQERSEKSWVSPHCQESCARSSKALRQGGGGYDAKNKKKNKKKKRQQPPQSKKPHPKNTKNHKKKQPKTPKKKKKNPQKPKRKKKNTNNHKIKREKKKKNNTNTKKKKNHPPNKKQTQHRKVLGEGGFINCAETTSLVGLTGMKGGGQGWGQIEAPGKCRFVIGWPLGSREEKENIKARCTDL